MGNIFELIGGVFLVFGSISLLIAAIGLYRMPDFYNRIQIGTKASTFGVLLTIIGIAFLFPGWIPKLLAMLLFVLFTNPISSHVIARAAYFTKVPLSDKTKVDKLQEVSEGHLKKVKTKE
ncbi:MAG: monovalent cation/H(+) antiporter subunit G [Bacteroidota bacterium]